MKRAFLFIAILAFTLQTFAQEEQKSPYIEYEYSKCGDTKLKADASAKADGFLKLSGVMNLLA